MALKSREKLLVGVMLIAGSIALGVGVALPMLDEANANLANKSALETDIKSLTDTKQMVETLVMKLEQKQHIPKDVVIRQYNAGNLEEMIKAILDQIVGQATAQNNVLVSLKPYQAEPFVPPPAEDETKKQEGSNAAASGDAKKEEEPEPPPLQTFGYEIVFRGNYNSIYAFLKSLDTSKELVEINSISLNNEREPGATAAAALDQVPADPSKPLLLTTKIRLVLKPAAQ